ncbi:hypothetical protein GEMRC1_002614 [Eukaryota sp. GEM-RC1]
MYQLLKIWIISVSSCPQTVNYLLLIFFNSKDCVLCWANFSNFPEYNTDISDNRGLVVIHSLIQSVLLLNGSSNNNKVLKEISYDSFSSASIALNILAVLQSYHIVRDFLFSFVVQCTNIPPFDLLFSSSQCCSILANLLMLIPNSASFKTSSESNAHELVLQYLGKVVNSNALVENILNTRDHSIIAAIAPCFSSVLNIVSSSIVVADVTFLSDARRCFSAFEYFFSYYSNLEFAHLKSSKLSHYLKCTSLFLATFSQLLSLISNQSSKVKNTHSILVNELSDRVVSSEILIRFIVRLLHFTGTHLNNLNNLRNIPQDLSITYKVINLSLEILIFSISNSSPHLNHIFDCDLLSLIASISFHSRLSDNILIFFTVLTRVSSLLNPQPFLLGYFSDDSLEIFKKSIIGYSKSNNIFAFLFMENLMKVEQLGLAEVLLTNDQQIKIFTTFLNDFSDNLADVIECFEKCVVFVRIMNVLKKSKVSNHTNVASEVAKQSSSSLEEYLFKILNNFEDIFDDNEFVVHYCYVFSAVFDLLAEFLVYTKSDLALKLQFFTEKFTAFTRFFTSSRSSSNNSIPEVPPLLSNNFINYSTHVLQNDYSQSVSLFKFLSFYCQSKFYSNVYSNCPHFASLISSYNPKSSADKILHRRVVLLLSAHNPAIVLDTYLTLSETVLADCGLLSSTIDLISLELGYVTMTLVASLLTSIDRLVSFIENIGEIKLSLICSIMTGLSKAMALLYLSKSERKRKVIANPPDDDDCLIKIDCLIASILEVGFCVLASFASEEHYNGTMLDLSNLIGPTLDTSPHQTLSTNSLHSQQNKIFNYGVCLGVGNLVLHLARESSGRNTSSRRRSTVDSLRFSPSRSPTRSPSLSLPPFPIPHLSCSTTPQGKVFIERMSRAAGFCVSVLGLQCTANDTRRRALNLFSHLADSLAMAEDVLNIISLGDIAANIQNVCENKLE